MRTKDILVIDDELPILVMLQKLLEEEAFHVRVASDGPSGLAEVARRHPDLILCDQRMPGLAGHEVCERLYGDPATQQIPVIIMSAHAHELTPMPPNCLLFLRKPFRIIDILYGIDDILGENERTVGT